MATVKKGNRFISKANIRYFLEHFMLLLHEYNLKRLSSEGLNALFEGLLKDRLKRTL